MQAVPRRRSTSCSVLLVIVYSRNCEKSRENIQFCEKCILAQFYTLAFVKYNGGHMTFTDKVRELLSQKNISINKMLTDLGLGKGTFATWEKRGTVPGGETLNKLADYFGVSVDYLLGKSYTEQEEVTQQEKELLAMLKQLNEEDLETALRIVQRLAEKK